MICSFIITALECAEHMQLEIKMITLILNGIKRYKSPIIPIKLQCQHHRNSHLRSKQLTQNHA